MYTPCPSKTSPTLNGWRIEHLSEDVGWPEANILRLLKAAFGGDDSPPYPANERWLLWAADRLLGQVSAQRRWFVVNGHYLEGWLIGGVCVDPSVQRSGIGTLLMQQANADLSRQGLDFAVLNCGRHLLGFYGGVGYGKIADRALYIRGDTVLIEPDPAMAISFREGFDVSALRCETFPFGFDF